MEYGLRTLSERINHQSYGNGTDTLIDKATGVIGEDEKRVGENDRVLGKVDREDNLTGWGINTRENILQQN